MKKTESTQNDLSPTQQIDAFIANISDWRGPLIARSRALVHEASPDLTEDWKWGTPVFAAKGYVLAIGAFKENVKMNFFKGAFLEDPTGLFNAGLDAKATRAIDIHQNDEVDESPLKDLIQAAVNCNLTPGK